MNNPVFSQKERNIIILIIVLALGGILLYAMKGIFGAFLGTLVMYDLLRNLNIFLIERWRWLRSFSAVFIILLSLVIIVLPFVGIGAMLVNKAVELKNNPEWLTRLVDAINDFVGTLVGTPALI